MTLTFSELDIMRGLIVGLLLIYALVVVLAARRDAQ